MNDLFVGDIGRPELAGEAIHFPMPKVLNNELDLPKDKEIVVNCGTGYRSNIVASYLQHHGCRNVYSLAGGTTAWTCAGYDLTM